MTYSERIADAWREGARMEKDRILGDLADRGVTLILCEVCRKWFVANDASPVCTDCEIEEMEAKMRNER